MASVASKLKGPFKPSARLDPSQVVDQRAPTPMDYAHFEDGSSGFVEDPGAGARIPSVGQRKWWPLPPQGKPVGYHPPPIPSRFPKLPKEPPILRDKYGGKRERKP